MSRGDRHLEGATLAMFGRFQCKEMRVT